MLDPVQPLEYETGLFDCKHYFLRFTIIHLHFSRYTYPFITFLVNIQPLFNIPRKLLCTRHNSFGFLNDLLVHRGSLGTHDYMTLKRSECKWPYNQSYYMTSSVSGQDEPNRALWLATRAGKMERYCPLGISRLVPQDQRSFFGVLSHTINPLLTKLVLSRWLDIGLVLFCVFMDLDEHAKKQLGQYPAILTEQAWSITHI